MIAAWRGHSSIVAELVRAGAQIDAQDQVCMVAQASGPGFDSRWLPGFFLFQLALGCRWGDESVCAHPC